MGLMALSLQLGWLSLLIFQVAVGSHSWMSVWKQLHQGQGWPQGSVLCAPGGEQAAILK